MQIIETIDVLRRVRRAITEQVGLVPTMGYLHQGHLSLVEYARQENNIVIATIFVNPTQFGQGEDLESYPRDLPRDYELLESAGVDYVFVPSPDLMYPKGFHTSIHVEHVTQGLEGEHRAGHFKGVATVVAKLFNLVQPDKAYFGQKDAQQVVVIRQMIRDLNFPVEIAVCPIVRETDGLAMSSRNIYLSPEERTSATVLYNAIQAIGQAYQSGERHPKHLLDIGRDMIEAEPLAELNYIALTKPDSLNETIEPTEKPMLLSMAVKVGQPRLLDNCLLPLSLNNRKDASKILGIQ